MTITRRGLAHVIRHTWTMPTDYTLGRRPISQSASLCDWKLRVDPPRAEPVGLNWLRRRISAMEHLLADAVLDALRGGRVDARARPHCNTMTRLSSRSTRRTSVPATCREHGHTPVLGLLPMLATEVAAFSETPCAPVVVAEDHPCRAATPLLVAERALRAMAH